MTASGLTFDTGVLIALERRSQRVWKIYREAMRIGVRVSVPSPVIAEWWRGRTDARVHVKSGFLVEPLTERVAELAGEALAAVRGSTVVDAIVMASAASRGDVVYTGDVTDLERLRAYFPSVRVLSV